MGESATAMGRGRAVGPMPASRPTGRDPAWGTGLVPPLVPSLVPTSSGEASGSTASGTQRQFAGP